MHVNPYSTHVHANVIGLDPPAHRRCSSAAKCVTTINGYFWLFSLWEWQSATKVGFHHVIKPQPSCQSKYTTTTSSSWTSMSTQICVERFHQTRQSNLRGRTNNRCAQRFPFTFNSYQRTMIEPPSVRTRIGTYRAVHIASASTLRV